jgi:hypothetical protein
MWRLKHNIMINKDFNSVIELLEAFPDEQTCINHLEALRWNGNVISPFDPISTVYKCKNNRYRCRNTGKYFNVRTFTLFDNTKVELRKWFLAIYIVTSHKKGISSLQLSKDIDVTQKTAWFMLQRIRNCFDNDVKLNNEVEIDETYFGGRNSNKHILKQLTPSDGHHNKTTILGMVERKGKLIAKPIEKASTEILTREISARVNMGSVIYTDESKGYKDIDMIYKHKRINHSKNEYVNGRVYTNTVEGFWSLLKRGIWGIYHSTSKKHLHRYVDEYVFRYNTRYMLEFQRFNLMLANTEYKLTYKSLIR